MPLYPFRTMRASHRPSQRSQSPNHDGRTRRSRRMDHGGMVKGRRDGWWLRLRDARIEKSRIMNNLHGCVSNVLRSCAQIDKSTKRPKRYEQCDTNHVSLLLMTLRRQFHPVKCQDYTTRREKAKVLTQTDHIDHQHPILQRHEGKVDRLHEWPNTDVGLVALEEGGAQLLDGIRALHDSHGRQEARQLRRGEEYLVYSHSGRDSTSLAVCHDIALKKAKPCRGSRSKDR